MGISFRIAYKANRRKVHMILNPTNQLAPEKKKINFNGL
jgi:hypothetical protein